MAIDDNTSYELTGAQVKDLANRIKAKAADNIFVGATSAAPGSKGLVPAPQAADDTKFLSGDGTWKTVSSGSSYTAGNGIAIDANNEISIDDTVVAELVDIPGVMIGATPSAPGVGGTVPAPASGDNTKFLSGDGTWKTVSGGASKTVFIWENGAMYDEDYNTVSGGDVYTAVQSGDVEVVNSMSSLIVENGIHASWTDPTYGVLTDVLFFTVERTSLTGVMTRTQYLYDESNGWLEPREMNIQKQLTAGTNITISNNTISATDTTYSDFTGATASVAGSNGLVPAPAAGDGGKALHGDGTWKDTTAKLVEMSYGESNSWAKFIAAYNAGSIVYCRASSNANPATGSQTRKAFMAYVNNATSPTNVEFQYVRSQSSKTDSQQCDQVFVYKLTNASGGTWTVETRNMAPKINVSGPITKTFTTGANATITIGANAMTGATASAAGATGVVPAPAAGDNEKFLCGDGTWQTVGGGATTFYWFESFDPVSGSSHYDLFTDDGHTVVADDSDVLNAFNAGGAIVYDEDAGVINAVISMGFTGDSFITIDANGTKEYSYNGVPLPGGAAWTRS